MRDTGGSRRARAGHAALLLALGALLALPAHAQTSRESRPPASGTMSRQELAREPIRVQFDLPYAAGGEARQRLDVYLPRQRTVKRLPVIVFLHGGDWQRGDKGEAARRLVPLVRSGRFAGVAAGYRYGTAAPWPAPLHDAKAVVRWVRANAARHGWDPDRIGVWGQGAGGQLALLLGTTSNVVDLEGEVGAHGGTASRVQAVVNFGGAVELLVPASAATAEPRSPLSAAALLGTPAEQQPAAARAASPLFHVDLHDAPVLTVHGSADAVVPYAHAQRLDAALRAAGVPSWLVRVQGAGHDDLGTRADGRVRAFFDRTLHGRNVEVPTRPIVVRR